MNGKIISQIDFRFFYNSKKHVSVVKLVIEASDYINKKTNYIFAKAYDDIADTIFSAYDKNSRIIFCGEMRENYVEIKDIEYHNKIR